MVGIGGPGSGRDRLCIHGWVVVYRNFCVVDVSAVAWPRQNHGSGGADLENAAVQRGRRDRVSSVFRRQSFDWAEYLAEWCFSEMDGNLCHVGKYIVLGKFSVGSAQIQTDSDSVIVVCWGINPLGD